MTSTSTLTANPVWHRLPTEWINPSGYSLPSRSLSSSFSSGPYATVGPLAIVVVLPLLRSLSAILSRPSSDMKSRAPLPVPSGAQPSQNGHSRNLSGLDMTARSPPNQSSKSSPRSSLCYDMLKLLSLACHETASSSARIGKLTS